MLQIAAIHFSHAAGNGAASALKLRKNAFQLLPAPEWRRGFVRTEDSAVAYAMGSVVAHANRVSINVKFNITGAGAFPSTIFIRAIQPPLTPGPHLWSSLLSTHYNVLGEVSERAVSVAANGETPFLTFELKNHKITEWGVGVFAVLWHWQYRLTPHDSWQTFHITRHKTFIVLKKPTLPFDQDFQGGLLLPWTDILDYACAWAAGSKTEDEAASKITRKLFSLAPAYFEYNCVNFLPAYVQILDIAGNSFFNCTNFLLHLQTNSVNRFIICSDCAAIVSTFVNILGCDLWQSKMETPGTMFEVNRILPIGSLRWQTPCGVPGFAYHEVAWKNSCTSADPIFDACLAVDGSSTPLDAFSIPLLPVNILLGNQGSGLYRDRLVVPRDWQLSEPRPGTRLRRMLIPGIPAFPFFAVRDLAADIQEADSVRAVERQLDINELPRTAPAKQTVITNFSLDKTAFNDWNIRVQDLFEGVESIRQILHMQWRSVHKPNTALRVDIAECKTANDARKFASRILVAMHAGVATVIRDRSIGDIGFTWIGEKTILFVRSNLCVMLANSDRQTMSVRDLADRLDDYIRSFAAPLKPEVRASVRSVSVDSGAAAETEAVNRWKLQ